MGRLHRKRYRVHISRSGTITIALISVLSVIQAFMTGCRQNNPVTQAQNSLECVRVLELMPGRDNPRNSEGDFITLKDGRIMFIYSHYTGKSGDDNGNAFLAARYSADNGITWSADDAEIVAQEGRMNVMSVSLLRLKNGEIALFYLRKNSETDCIPLVRFSNDESVTWSDPLRCITDRDGYFVLNNSRVIQLSNGRLLFSVARHQSPGEKSASDIGEVWSYYSDDNGRTWKSGSQVGNPGGTVIQEPGLVELKNGTILMYLRTRSGVQYFSDSEDNGVTWSNVRPGNIPSPCSPALIVRMPSSDDLLLVWNDNGKDQKRTPLNIAVSPDEGERWIKNRIIRSDPDGVYCYPAVCFVNDHILLSYSDWATMGTTVLKFDRGELYK